MPAGSSAAAGTSTVSPALSGGVGAAADAAVAVREVAGVAASRGRAVVLTGSVDAGTPRRFRPGRARAGGSRGSWCRRRRGLSRLADAARCSANGSNSDSAGTSAHKGGGGGEGARYEKTPCISVPPAVIQRLTSKPRAGVLHGDDHGAGGTNVAAGCVFAIPNRARVAAILRAGRQVFHAHIDADFAGGGCPARVAQPVARRLLQSQTVGDDVHGHRGVHVPSNVDAGQVAVHVRQTWHHGPQVHQAQAELKVARLQRVERHDVRQQALHVLHRHRLHRDGEWR